MILVTLLSSIGATVQLIQNKFQFDSRNEVLAAVLLGALLLEIPIIYIAHRHHADRRSFHENATEPQLTKTNPRTDSMSDHGVYQYNSRFHE